MPRGCLFTQLIFKSFTPLNVSLFRVAILFLRDGLEEMTSSDPGALPETSVSTDQKRYPSLTSPMPASDHDQTINPILIAQYDSIVPKLVITDHIQFTPGEIPKMDRPEETAESGSVTSVQSDMMHLPEPTETTGKLPPSSVSSVQTWDIRFEAWLVPKRMDDETQMTDDERYDRAPEPPSEEAPTANNAESAPDEGYGTR